MSIQNRSFRSTTGAATGSATASWAIPVRQIASFLLPVAAITTGCAKGDDAASLPTTITALTVPASAEFPLTMRAAGAAQEAVAANGDEVRLRTALRTDDDAEARLCGVIVSRSRSRESLPFAWPVDSALPLLVPQLVNGPDVQGYRVVVPGVNSEYRFEGFTTDGTTRVSFRWPVRSAHPVPGDAADSEIEAALTPAPKALDSLIMGLRRAEAAGSANGAIATPWRGRRLPADSVSETRAVRLAHLLPLFPSGFTTPCGDATFKVSLASAVDKPVRVLASAGEQITAHVVTPTGEVTAYFDELGPGGAVTGKKVTTSVEAKAAGHVTLRLRYNPAEKVEPGRQTVLLRLMSSTPR